MQGTFKACSKCNGNKNCCTNFEDVDNPIISSKEKELICQTTNCDNKVFAKIEDGCYNINTIGGVCPFYKKGCTFYDIRPNDCKLYPYDIRRVDGRLYLIRYKLECLKDCAVNEDVDEIVECIKFYMQTYINKIYNQKVSLFDYEIIKEIKG